MSFIDKIFPKSDDATTGASAQKMKAPSRKMAKLKGKFSKSTKSEQAVPPPQATTESPTPNAVPTPTTPTPTTTAQTAISPPATKPTEQPVPPTAPSTTGISSRELTKRRDTLAIQRREMQWDLGGLVYEMSIRDHFRLDVVVARAAKLQEVDSQLAAVERILRMNAQGAAGDCPKCAAVYSRGAVYCWQCGHQLLERSASTAVPSPS